MSVISHLGLLGLAAALCSPIRDHQIDFKATSPDGIQRIDQVWFVTYVNDAGQEIVVQAKTTTGEYAPLIAVDPTRLESIVAGGRNLAKENNVKLRLIKFTNRLDIEDITPCGVEPLSSIGAPVVATRIDRGLPIPTYRNLGAR
jgi:hypothetical protein